MRDASREATLKEATVMTASDLSEKSRLELGVQPEDFFKEVVENAVVDQRIDTSSDSQVYLVALLADYAKRPQLQEVGEPFGVRLALAMNTSGGERFERLRTLGDDVLFISGFYSDHLRHRGLQLDYVSELGSVAYGGVASILRRHSKDAPVVFDELSDRFSAFVSLLQHVADSLMADALRDETDLLGLYQRWSRTGSRALADALVRMGVSPTRKQPGLN